jgi:hypothetical protein
MPACRYEFLDPDSNRIPNYFSFCVWIRIRTVIHIIFPLCVWIRIRTVIQVILYHYEVWIRIRTVFPFILSTVGPDPDSNRYPFSSFTMCFGSGFEPFSKQASHLRVFLLTFQARAYFKPHVLISYVIFSGPGSGFSHHFFL